MPSSQSDDVSSSTKWWTYLAGYGDLVGSTRVDMGLCSTAPQGKLPYLLIIGTSYMSSREDKLPDLSEKERLDQVSDHLIRSVLRLGPAIYAGTFTNDLEQVHFVYVSGLEGAKVAFDEEHARQCPNASQVFIEKHDPGWEQYLDFLYPSQATIEFYGYDAVTNRSAR